MIFRKADLLDCKGVRFDRLMLALTNAVLARRLEMPNRKVHTIVINHLVQKLPNLDAAVDALKNRTLELQSQIMVAAQELHQHTERYGPLETLQPVEHMDDQCHLIDWFKSQDFGNLTETIIDHPFQLKIPPSLATKVNDEILKRQITLYKNGKLQLGAYFQVQLIIQELQLLQLLPESPFL